MFTGLIQDVGTVRSLRRGGESARLSVATLLPMDDLLMGESIAVNGVCLTVVSFGGGSFEADLSPESLERSTLGDLAPGSPVNLERALRLCDRLGGHLVSGHVDGVATVSERRKDANAIRFSFRIPPALSRYLVEKGSIAIEGVSLTVNEVGPESFKIAVIPHTLAATTLKDIGPGCRVNIETDILGKYVERLLKGGGKDPSPSGGVDMHFLAKHGFL
jgi:riboflavin synthase